VRGDVDSGHFILVVPLLGGGDDGGAGLEGRCLCGGRSTGKRLVALNQGILEVGLHQGNQAVVVVVVTLHLISPTIIIVPAELRLNGSTAVGIRAPPAWLRLLLLLRRRRR
jgi:hypothetical protein